MTAGFLTAKTKFKVGDKVKIVKLTPDSTPLKSIYIGKTATIRWASPDMGRWPYMLDIDNGERRWTDEELEPAQAVCTCDLMVLMRSGCKCGAFKNEKTTSR